MEAKKVRTRQELRRKTNPKGKDYIIGLDIGYSGTKVFYEDGYFVFPSYAKKIEKGMLEMANEKDILYRDDIRNEVYMVGYNAQNMIDDTDTNDTDAELFSRKRYGSLRFKIIANVALALATGNKKDNRKIVVQTGLPSAYVNGDTSAITKALAKPAEFSIKIGGGEWRKFNIEVNEKDIYVMPQPAGSLYSVLIKDDGNYIPNAKELLCSNVLVMDIGFGTFDFYGIKNRSIDCTESVNEVGMRMVLDKVSKKILEDTNEDIKIAALQQSLESGTFTYIDEEEMSAEEKSIAPYLNEANREVWEDAMQKAKSITTSFRGYKHLIISGGTGEAWYEDIKKWLEKMKTLEIIPSNRNDHLPFLYENARGYYLYRYVLNKR